MMDEKKIKTSFKNVSLKCNLPQKYISILYEYERSSLIAFREYAASFLLHSSWARSISDLLSIEGMLILT